MLTLRQILFCFVVLVFAGSSLAVTEYTYEVQHKKEYSGSTQPGVVGLADDLRLGNWGEVTEGIGWTYFEVPDFGSQTITEVIWHTKVAGFNCGSPKPGLQINRVGDDSWTSATITHDWAVTDDSMVVMNEEGEPEINNPWGEDKKQLDITSWFGAGKESITGGEVLSVRFIKYPEAQQDDPSQNMWITQSSSKNYLEITTIPEPATIALLGLGGLALIRRKR